MVTIESNSLRVMIEEDGAQMCSIFSKNLEIELLWQRDPNYWKSSAPVVFPVIGKLNNLKMIHNNEEYHLKSNGLIRYETIPVAEYGKDFVSFKYQNKTREKFPFLCTVFLTYKVLDNKLIVEAKITNDGNENMYYLYAGHPGFNVPFYEYESCNDYYIEFEKSETLNIFDVCETGQLIDKELPFFENEKRFFIRKDLFLKEALAFKHPISNSVYIKSIRHNHEIKVNFDGFDNLAIWSPYYKDKDLKFICVEPWVGHTEFKDFVGEWKNHDEIACLKPNEEQVHTYSIEIK